MSAKTTTPAIPQNSRRANKTVPLLEFGRSLSSNLLVLGFGLMVFSIPALYTSLIADAGGMTVDALTTVSKADEIAHVVKVTEGWFPPTLVTKHETHIRFDPSSSHDFANEKFRTLFPTSIPFGYFMYSVLKSMIDSNYTISMGLHKMFYKLPESMTMLLAIIIMPLYYVMMFFVNVLLAGVFHLYHFKKYFISCVKDPENPAAKCTESDDYGPVSWIALFVYGIFGFFPSVLFLIPVLTLAYCFITPLLVSSKLAKGGNYDFFQFLGGVLSYKRQLIMWIISLVLLKVTASTLGPYQAGGCLAAILCLAGLTKVYSRYIPSCVVKKGK